MAYGYVGVWSNSANGNTVTVAPTAGNLLVFWVGTSVGAGNPTWSVNDNLASGGYVVQHPADGNRAKVVIVDEGIRLFQGMKR